MDKAAAKKKAKRKKVNFVGAPAIFLLEQACRTVASSFGGFGCYLVGSAIERPDYRDVDIRLMLPDEEFEALFPDASIKNRTWEFDPRWLLVTTSVSLWMSRFTGLTVDFQIQAQTPANESHKGERQPMGLQFAKRIKE